jgi:hypothetical protein
MIVNRQPFLLSDTMTYIRGADAAVYKSLGTPTDWTERYHQRFDAHVTTGRGGSAADAGKPVILAGRSIYYGAFLYLADRFTGLKLAVVLQAILGVICLQLTIMRFGRMRAQRAARFLVAFAAVLAVGSSLAYFACYLEPDLTCALAILAASHLLTDRPLLDRRTACFWFFVLSLCTLMNSSTILVLIVITLAAGLGTIFAHSVSRRGIALLVASILIGISAEAVFHGVVLREFGPPPVRPPFLMARLIADGPGQKYLEQNCPRAGFMLCDHLATISAYDNAGDSDSFLWSHDLRNGIFSAVSPAERRRLAAQEPQFVIAVIRDRPAAVLRSSIGAVIDQGSRWRLPEFNVLPSQRKEFADGLPARVWEQQDSSLAFKRAMPVRLTEALAFPLALFSLAIILVRLRYGTPRSDLGAFYVLLLIGIVADVVICGAISTPHDRYLMRIAWLIPMSGALAAVAGAFPFTGSHVEARLRPSKQGPGTSVDAA